VQGYIHQDTLEWLGEPLPNDYNTLYLTISGDPDDEAHLATVSDLVREDFEDHGGTILRMSMLSLVFCVYSACLSYF